MVELVGVGVAPQTGEDRSTTPEGVSASAWQNFRLFRPASVYSLDFYHAEFKQIETTQL